MQLRHPAGLAVVQRVVVNRRIIEQHVAGLQLLQRERLRRDPATIVPRTTSSVPRGRTSPTRRPLGPCSSSLARFRKSTISSRADLVAAVGRFLQALERDPLQLGRNVVVEPGDGRRLGVHDLVEDLGQGWRR